jgi:NADH-quinone oxidoreductase subunit H
MEFLKDLIINIGLWFQEWLTSAGLSEVWVRVIALFVGAFVLALAPQVAVVSLDWLDARVVARIGGQPGLRDAGAHGGPRGLRQALADALQALTQEDTIPAAADRWTFNIAPVLALTSALLTWAVIPLGRGLIGSDLNIGILYILSLGSGSVVAMLMSGWGCDDKDAPWVTLRDSATWISSQIPQALSVLAVVMLAGSFSMRGIVEAQDVPFLIALPLTALLYLASLAPAVERRRLERIPADAEIAAGSLAGYSGVRRGLFYLAESIHYLAAAAIFSTLFLGGWRGPWVDQVPVLSTLWLVLKVLLFTLLIALLQPRLPRLRMEQMVSLNWKVLTPLALVNACVVALVGKAMPASVGPWVRAGTFLGANVLVGLAVWLAVSRKREAG